MRPAQLTPENPSPFGFGWRNGPGRFNEAGAINAGKRDHVHAGLPEIEEASMRPAQLTPENMCVLRVTGAEIPCFNEAGAINAGKRAVQGGHVLPPDPASMRPAQLTPENLQRQTEIKHAALALQ